MDLDRSSKIKHGVRPGDRKAVLAVDSVRVPTATSGPPGLDIVGLFRTERSSLYRTAKRYLHNSGDAADLVQDAFTRLLQAGAITSIHMPAAYLQRIVRNLVRDRFRRAETRMTFIDVTTCDKQAAVPPEQSWAIEAEQLLAGYADAVTALPAKTRSVFVLHRVDGLRYRDIAVKLGVSVAAVEYHMARALVQLDKTLNR